MSPYRPTFYGIDPEVIEQATRKARRERAEAVWSMLHGIFPSVSDKDRRGDNPEGDAACPRIVAAAP